MNQLKVFKDTVEHKPCKEFLYYANFTEKVLEKMKKKTGLTSIEEIKEHLGMYQPHEFHLTESEVDTSIFKKYFKNKEAPENAFINSLGVLEIPGSIYHFTSYVSPLRNIKDLDEIEKFPFPEVKDYSVKDMKKQVEKAHEKNKVTVTWVGHMYESAWQIRGYEQFLMDMKTNPEICEYILDRLCEKNIEIARAAAKAGVDVIRTGDDVANQQALMFSKELWEKFIKTKWAKVYKEARKIKPDIQIWYHSDGNIKDIIPDLIDIGITILNPVQPECLDVEKINEKYGDKLIFDGTIGTQTTMPFSDPEEVKKVVRKRKKTIGKNGGLILSPTHVLEPEVPVENIMAFVEAARE